MELKKLTIYLSFDTFRHTASDTSQLAWSSGTIYHENVRPSQQYTLSAIGTWFRGRRVWEDEVVNWIQMQWWRQQERTIGNL